MLSSFLRASAVALVLAPLAASATSTVALPPGACGPLDVVLSDGFEPAGAALPSDPSHGSGGALGNQTGTVSVAGYGTGTYYVYVPLSYDPARPMPVLV